LVPALEACGHTVARHSTEDGHIAHSRFESGAEVVIHLAAQIFVPDSWRRPLEFYEVNVLGTANVLEYCRQNRSGLIFISSYVYGHPERLPIRETDRLEATNPYAHSKLMGEDLCRFYQERHGVEVAIVRPFNLYGPGQSGHFLIPRLVGQAVSPETPEFHVADAAPKRDFIHVDDLVRLLMRLVEGPQQGTYNAGSGASYSVAEIAAMLNAITGSAKPLRDRAERRPNELMDVVADITAARDRLGWGPRTVLKDGLRQLVTESAHQNG
jgi:nucleoside-diphosphate-sugar epimerase